MAKSSLTLRHSITVTDYTVRVREAIASKIFRAMDRAIAAE